MLKKRFFKTKDEVEVTFEVPADEAERADVVCEFNGWTPIPMKKSRKGPFRAKMRFPKEASFEFRYLLDESRWINDADADRFEPNGLGSRNGVLETTPPA